MASLPGNARGNTSVKGRRFWADQSSSEDENGLQQLCAGGGATCMTWLASDAARSESSSSCSNKATHGCLSSVCPRAQEHFGDADQKGRFIRENTQPSSQPPTANAPQKWEASHCSQARSVNRQESCETFTPATSSASSVRSGSIEEGVEPRHRDALQPEVGQEVASNTQSDQDSSPPDTPSSRRTAEVTAADESAPSNTKPHGVPEWGQQDEQECVASTYVGGAAHEAEEQTKGFPRASSQGPMLNRHATPQRFSIPLPKAVPVAKELPGKRSAPRVRQAKPCAAEVSAVLSTVGPKATARGKPCAVSKRGGGVVHERESATQEGRAAAHGDREATPKQVRERIKMLEEQARCLQEQQHRIRATGKILDRQAHLVKGERLALQARSKTVYDQAVAIQAEHLALLAALKSNERVPVLWDIGTSQPDHVCIQDVDVGLRHEGKHELEAAELTERNMMVIAEPPFRQQAWNTLFRSHSFSQFRICAERIWTASHRVIRFIRHGAKKEEQPVCHEDTRRKRKTRSKWFPKAKQQKSGQHKQWQRFIVKMQAACSTAMKLSFRVVTQSGVFSLMCLFVVLITSTSWTGDHPVIEEDGICWQGPVHDHIDLTLGEHEVPDGEYIFPTITLYAPCLLNSFATVSRKYRRSASAWHYVKTTSSSRLVLRNKNEEPLALHRNLDFDSMVGFLSDNCMPKVGRFTNLTASFYASHTQGLVIGFFDPAMDIEDVDTTYRPMLTTLANSVRGRYYVSYMDANMHPWVASEFGITSYPAVVVQKHYPGRFFVYDKVMTAAQITQFVIDVEDDCLEYQPYDPRRIFAVATKRYCDAAPVLGR